MTDATGSASDAVEESWGRQAWPEPRRVGTRRLRQASRSRPGRRARPELEQAVKVLPALLEDLSRRAGWPLDEAGGDWRVHVVGLTSTRSVVATVGPGGTPVAVVKLPRSPSALRAMESERDRICSLRDGLEGPLLEVVPALLATGRVDGQPYAVYSCLPGVPAALDGVDPRRDRRLVCQAASVAATLHRLGCRQTTVTATVMARWVDQPAELVGRALGCRPRGLRHSRSFSRLVDDLRGELGGSTLSLGWVHGDLWLGNVLVDFRDGQMTDGQVTDGQVTGLVDWDKAEPSGLAALDILHLVLFTRSVREGRDLGQVVRSALLASRWSAEEEELLALVGRAADDSVLSRRCLLGLYWLRQSALELTERAGCDRHLFERPASLLWERRNLDPVLTSW